MATRQRGIRMVVDEPFENCLYLLELQYFDMFRLLQKISTQDKQLGWNILRMLCQTLRVNIDYGDCKYILVK